MFYQTWRSPDFIVIRRNRGDDRQHIVGSVISVEVEFRAETLDGGEIVPVSAIQSVAAKMSNLFAGTMLIAQDDPQADALMKLTRIKAIDPVLMDSGTTGAGLAFFVGTLLDDWLSREAWNREGRVALIEARVIIDKEDTYAYAPD